MDCLSLSLKEQYLKGLIQISDTKLPVVSLNPVVLVCEIENYGVANPIHAICLLFNCHA